MPVARPELPANNACWPPCQIISLFYYVMDTPGKIVCKTMEKPCRDWQFFQVEATHAGRRLDNYLLSRLGLPRSALYRLLRRGHIRMNGGRVGPGRRLAGGERIRVPPLPVPPPNPERPIPSLKAPILYEDEHLLALDKPTGMAVHGGSGLTTDLRRQARYYRQRPLELAHRLDKDTSGCLLLCSDPRLLAWLHECFRRGYVTKTYLALVRGQPPTHMDIRFPLRRLSGGSVVAHPEGSTARTRLRVICRYADAALVQLRPLTGRMHQLRAHTAEVGHPVVGDTRYGERWFNRAFRQHGLNRLFLHARTLTVPLPAGGRLHLKAPLPPSLWQVLRSLGDYPAL